MKESGLGIRNIKAATLYGYNLGVRDRYDYTAAMLSRSLFRIHMEQNGLQVHKGESTRDIICLDFDFGSKSYEDEIRHLEQLLESSVDGDSAEHIKTLIDKVNSRKDFYCKKTKDEIRSEFYSRGVKAAWDSPAGKTVDYLMLYRNASKAKTGQVIFIRKELYGHAYDWLTMGLGGRMPLDNAKIVELSAYAPLVTSTIVDTLHIPVEDILILKDQDSFFTTIADVVRSDDYEAEERVLDEEKTFKNREKALRDKILDGKGDPVYRKSYSKTIRTLKKCTVSREKTSVKNTIWDGMALVEAGIFPSWVNGMGLLRNHFFKACGFKALIQTFFKDWCQKKGLDYDTYEVTDMFGVKHRLKDIKVITTDNAIKWKKFIDLMGGSPAAAYEYWKDRINADGSVFGIVKTDHPSKLGPVQQMSYQMLNTLPCRHEDVGEIARTSIDYVETLKKDNDEFERYLRDSANEVNHHEMLAELYAYNHAFANSKWFRLEKSRIITSYINRLRRGKITVNGDNLTICGNPYGLLLFSVGDAYEEDPSLNYEEGAIQCFTTRFQDNEYLCAFRNPHNSPNNICYLHNHYSRELQTYFPFSDNILAVNCIRSDIQDRANGCDEDSDFFFVTNHKVMVRYARQCYRDYPTIVNRLKESGVTYKNTKLEYARMDSKLAKSQRYIGEASNLAQLAMTYYWTYGTKELYDSFVILSVLAQVVIDGCKREYEVDAVNEIERIKRLPCMNLKKTVTQDGKEKMVRCDYPAFMKYTKEVPVTKNGAELPYEDIREQKEKISLRINPELICPMNWLQEWLDCIRGISKTNTVDTRSFFIKMEGKPNSRQMTKIRSLVEEYNDFVKSNSSQLDNSEILGVLIEKNNRLIENLKKVKIGNSVTINRLIETALGIDSNVGGIKYKEATRYTRKMLNLLYRMDKDRFLPNFKKG